MSGTPSYHRGLTFSSPLDSVWGIPLLVLSPKVAFLVTVAATWQAFKLLALSCKPPYWVLHKDRCFFICAPLFYCKWCWILSFLRTLSCLPCVHGSHILRLCCTSWIFSRWFVCACPLRPSPQVKFSFFMFTDDQGKAWQLPLP